MGFTDNDTGAGFCIGVSDCVIVLNLLACGSLIVSVELVLFGELVSV